MKSSSFKFIKLRSDLQASPLRSTCLSIARHRLSHYCQRAFLTPAHTTITYDLPRPNMLYSSYSVHSPSVHSSSTNGDKPRVWFSSSSNKTKNQTKKRPTNACITCSGMKLGCDLKTPSCSRCERRQTPCEYPKRIEASTEPMTQASDALGGGVAPQASVVQTGLETSTTDIEDDSTRASTNQMKRSQY